MLKNIYPTTDKKATLLNTIGWEELLTVIFAAEKRGRKRGRKCGLREARDVLTDLVNNGHDDAGGAAFIAYDVIKDL